MILLSHNLNLKASHLQLGHHVLCYIDGDGKADAVCAKRLEACQTHHLRRLLPALNLHLADRQQGQCRGDAGSMCATCLAAIWAGWQCGLCVCHTVIDETSAGWPRSK